MAMELFTPPSPSPSSLITSPFKPKPNSILFSPSTTPPHRTSPSSSSSSSSSSTGTTNSSSVSAIAAALPSLSSAFCFSLAGAASATVSYDDIVAPSTTSEGGIDATSAFDAASPLPSLDLDVGGIVDSVTGFVSENPVAVIGGIAAIGIPLLISRLFFSQGDEKPYAIVSAREAFKKLETSGGEDGFLLDIRSLQDVKIEGSPDLRSIKKRSFQIPYVEDQDEVFLKKLLSKFKDPSNTTLYILDQFDGNSLSVAKLATSNGFKFAYAIKDGAEGPNGWRKNELPWLLPRKGFTLDIDALKDVIDGTFGESGNLVPASLGVAAAAGVSFVLFSEAETALQLLGSAALVQVFINKLLFAKDRQKTLQELQLFLDTKVAPKELVDEFKGVSGSLLTKFEEIAPSQKNGAVLNIESPPQVEVKVESESVATVVVDEKNNSVEVDIVVKEEVDVVVKEKTDNVAIDAVVEEKKETVAIGTNLPSSSTPLSPYAQFPDLKPPPPPMPTIVGEKNSSVEVDIAVKEEVDVVVKEKNDNVEIDAVVEEKKEVVAIGTNLPSSTILSPYAQFPDLKPPPSPMPTIVGEKNNSVEVDIIVKEEVDVVVKEKTDNVEIDAVVEEKKETVAIGTNLSSSSTILSPYAQFPDLKPPPPPMPTKA